MTVLIRPAAQHAARRNDERHVAAARGGMRIVQREEPERVVVHTVSVGIGEAFP